MVQIPFYIYFTMFHFPLTIPTPPHHHFILYSIIILIRPISPPPHIILHKIQWPYNVTDWNERSLMGLKIMNVHPTTFFILIFGRGSCSVRLMLGIDLWEIDKKLMRLRVIVFLQIIRTDLKLWLRLARHTLLRHLIRIRHDNNDLDPPPS